MILSHDKLQNLTDVELIMFYLFLCDVEKICLNVEPSPKLSDEDQDDILDTIKSIKWEIDTVMDGHLEQAARSLVKRVGKLKGTT